MKTIALFTLIVVSGSAFAGAKKVTPKDTATSVCEEIFGAGASTDLLDSCKSSFAGFQQKERLLGVAEMAKGSIAKDPTLIDKMNQVGASVILQAAAEGQLVTQGATQPDLAYDWGVGRIDEDGGVVCEQAYDFSRDDEEGEVIPGVYDCKIRGGVWINYTVKNMCGEFPETKLDQQEQWINFQIKEDGSIDASTVKTSPLLIVNDQCAG